MLDLWQDWEWDWGGRLVINNYEVSNVFLMIIWISNIILKYLGLKALSKRVVFVVLIKVEFKFISHFSLHVPKVKLNLKSFATFVLARLSF